ncbi:malonyl-CoA/methylmalonyl-CoA synthetase [Saccharopolyspora erythraea NRRL 2338]|uniref:Acyl-CoA synthase n=2 Tax=Saccharopolyspora erythraea TaxID=1836 RepID=A4FGF3_SACEN|nr:acyl-CoA synthetase [Saccharopolyspora erythraea]PFG96833.1 malonyl-CoA/methylmalonyl-CoA synthetase [Saccharopolyspora erythraea NRRL 2338]QRK87072.1 acyl-CoA synthetase [Saccharopolyspora erythraea]CAM03128.1 acyl-CoA synthase [Saccharopolyspora erythraea NRRL 2338]
MGAAEQVLFPKLREPDEREALRFGERSLDYRELAGVTAALAERVGRARRVAVWATSVPETCAAVVGALAAGAAVVPINPKVGERELAHIVGDSRPELLLVAPGFEAPEGLGDIPVHEVDLTVRGGELPAEPDEEEAALIVYTSGTTGPPKGVVLPRRAIRANLDALAEAWEWTARDVLVHALPLFHVHGLILGTLGPLRLGGTVHHLGRFSSQGVAEELSGPATMMFGVPTMYHRLADDAEKDPRIAEAVGGARLLVSGSAALPAVEHERIERLTGQRVVERYGMSETIMNCGVRADGDRRPGYVGRPFAGVELRLVDEQGAEITESDDETVGEILVRGPNLFTGYLNRPDATEAAFTDGWFRTGDVATRAADGYIRIVGRRATDIIKSGGYKIGAGEIENALLEHPAVAEVAVTGEADPDLGERIVAWVVQAAEVAEQELADHVAKLLTPHKRPRVVRFVEALPRNEMGKVMKKALAG